MNLQQLRQNDHLREMLASEYVLGTLRGGARRRFEQWIAQDAVVRRSVTDWQGRLQPLAEFAPSEQPPARVWQAVEHRLALPVKSDRFAFWRGLRNDLSFWRGLGMTSTALATILVAVLLTRQPEVGLPAASYVATLEDEKSQLAVLVTGDAERGQLTVRVVSAPDIGPDRSLELWAIPTDGAPRSLGLIGQSGSVTLPLPSYATPENVQALAISLEPKGGSPNPDGPSGPVLYQGAWLQI